MGFPRREAAGTSLTSALASVPFGNTRNVALGSVLALGPRMTLAIALEANSIKKHPRLHDINLRILSVLLARSGRGWNGSTSYTGFDA